MSTDQQTHQPTHHDPGDPSHRYAVILAGGSGTRLWPLSTTEQPKQFQTLGDSRSLIAQTFDRLAACVPVDHVYVSTTKGYVDEVTASLPELDRANLICEPQPAGKPAAFLLVASHILARDPKAVILSAASDSFVAPLERFQESAGRAFDYVEQHRDWTAILGCRPTWPDVSLGYIRATGVARGTPGVRVLRDFAEKPDRDTAKVYAAEPDYFWNTSHYCFSAETLAHAYREAAEEMHTAVTSYFTSGRDEDYGGFVGPSHELDPLDKHGWRMAVVECDFNWYDIGTWPSVYRALSDSQGHKFIESGTGAHADLGSKKGLVVNESGLEVVTAGLDGLVVVVTDRVVLVASVERLQSDPTAIAALRGKVSEVNEFNEVNEFTTGAQS